MNHFRKFQNLSKRCMVLSRTPFHDPRTLFSECMPVFCYMRALHSVKASTLEKSGSSDMAVVSRASRVAQNRAQGALLDYLHCTRSLRFTDAEHISKNSPNFIQKLLKNVNKEEDIKRSLARYFRYHPINEFEPFFESLGFKPSEISLFLPRDLMFLGDDNRLLENYHVLCDYGVSRGKLGKMYIEANEIFGYHYGILNFKIRAYETLGLSKSAVIRLVTSTPHVLIGKVDEAFVKVLEELKGIGIDFDGFSKCLSEKSSYDWAKILGLLHFFDGMFGHNKQSLKGLFLKNPGFLLQSSRMEVYSLIGILLKFSVKMNEIASMFLQLPRVELRDFAAKLRQSLAFLFDNEMDEIEIRKILCSHLHMLGSCSLKTPATAREKLNIGKKRLCEIIKNDPTQLKQWVVGKKVCPLPSTGETEKDLLEKTKFLVKLGFVVGSIDMNKAQKEFRGKGSELQERFDSFVKAGLKPNDVSKMIKAAPTVLNQSKDVIEKKIDFLVNTLGYPVHTLIICPSYMVYTTDRVKLRFSMYEWLKNEGIVDPQLKLRTILATTENTFMRRFVIHHPRGVEVWEEIKKRVCIC